MPPPRMAHGMGGGWMGMRSLRQDRSVLEHRIKKGTTRRMLQFAVPYRKILAIFVPVVIVDSLVIVINPLIFRAIIDTAIPQKNTSLVLGLALAAAALALIDAGLSLYERRVSAVIGEGLIYDM